MSKIHLHPGPKKSSKAVGTHVVLKGVNQERYTVKVISLSKDKSEGEGVIQKIEEWKSYKIPFLKIGSCWTLKSKPEQVVIISFDYNHGKMAIVQ